MLIKDGPILMTSPVGSAVTSSAAFGTEVPIPTNPDGSTTNCVPVAEPITNEGWDPKKLVIESVPYGVAVAIPTLGNPPLDPTESIGGETVVVVPMLHALYILESTVDVDDCPYVTVPPLMVSRLVDASVDTLR